MAAPDWHGHTFPALACKHMPDFSEFTLWPLIMSPGGRPTPPARRRREYGPDQARDGVLVGEDADDLGAALDVGLARQVIERERLRS
jgi:hypothetical protein